jgi:hypothetical protein
VARPLGRIAAVAYYRISDPEKAVIVIENVYNAINQISQTTVRNVVGRFSLDQLLADTASINEQIKIVPARKRGSVSRGCCGLVAMGYQPSPSRATRRKAGGLSPPTQSGSSALDLSSQPFAFPARGNGCSMLTRLCSVSMKET